MDRPIKKTEPPSLGLNRGRNLIPEFSSESKHGNFFSGTAAGEQTGAKSFGLIGAIICRDDDHRRRLGKSDRIFDSSTDIQ